RGLSESSKLLYAVLHCWDQLGARSGATVETAIAREGSEHAGFRRSSRVTRELLRRGAARVRDVPLLLFCADGREPFHSEFRRIAREEGLTFVDGVTEEIRRAERDGECTRDGDAAHWNERGHEICARVLRERVEQALGRRTELTQQ